MVQKGVNGTVFAYGQTGSGKTFTMYGDEKKRERLLESNDGLGVVQRSVLELFKELNEKQNSSGPDQEEAKNAGKPRKATAADLFGAAAAVEEKMYSKTDDKGGGPKIQATFGEKKFIKP